VKAINPNIYPHGGYWFQDSDGSKHVGQSWAGVIARVKYYRENQGRPAETTADEVINQACSRTPNICTDGPPAEEQYRQVSLKSRVLLWLTRMKDSKEPKIFVDDGLRAARTDVCLRCSKHTSLPGGCGACVAALKSLKEAIVGSRPHDSRLQACLVSGEYMPVSIWLDQQAVVNAELPATCWRKRTL
jgi:hypothetical protein